MRRKPQQPLVVPDHTKRIWAAARQLLQDEQYKELLDYIREGTKPTASLISSLDPLQPGTPEQHVIYRLGQSSFFRILEDFDKSLSKHVHNQIKEI